MYVLNKNETSQTRWFVYWQRRDIPWHGKTKKSHGRQNLTTYSGGYIDRWLEEQLFHCNSSLRYEKTRIRPPIWYKDGEKSVGELFVMFSLCMSSSLERSASMTNERISRQENRSDEEGGKEIREKWEIKEMEKGNKFKSCGPWQGGEWEDETEEGAQE